MSRKTRKLIWSAPLVAVLAVAGALAIFVALAPGAARADHANLPGPVTDLKAEAKSRTSIQLSWIPAAASDTVGAPTSYRIDQSSDNRTWERLEVNAAGTPMAGGRVAHMITDNVSSATEMHYRVFAKNAAGTGPISNQPVTDYVNVGETFLPEAPETFTLSVRAVSYNQIDLSWTEPAIRGSAVTGYIVTEMINADDDGATARTACTDSNTCLLISEAAQGTERTAEHKMLTAGTTHYYQVTAVTAGTVGNTLSNVVGAVTPAAVVPGAPQHPVASPDESGGVFLYWLEPSSTGGQELGDPEVEYKLDADDDANDVTAWTDVTSGDITFVRSQAVETTPHNARYSNTEPGKYSFQIRSKQSGTTPGLDLVSGWVNFNGGRAVTIPESNDVDTGVPVQPALTATPKDATSEAGVGIRLTWMKGNNESPNDDTDDGPNPDDFRIDVSDDGLKWERGQINTININHWDDFNATSTAPRYYRLIAKNSNHYSEADGETATATPAVIAKPGTVLNLDATGISATEIRLDWGAATGADQYDLYVAHVGDNGEAVDDVDDTSETEVWDSLKANVKGITYTHSGLLPGSDRWYRIVSKKGTDVSGDESGAQARGKTLDAGRPGTPVDLVAESAKDSSFPTANERGVLLFWNETVETGVDPHDGYTVQRRIDKGTVEGAWETIEDDTESMTTSYHDDTEPVTDETARIYRVAARSGDGVGDWSNMVYYPNSATPHNAAPMPVGTITAVIVTEGQTTAAMDVSGYFSDADMDDLTYMATSDMEMYATVSVSGSMVTITGVAEGMATITVTATDAAGAYAMQTIMVTVEAADVTLGVPGGVMTSDATDDPGTLLVKVDWTPGNNAVGHLIMLFTDDWQGAPMVEAMPIGNSHTFTVDAGSYIAVVVAYDADGDIQLAISGVTSVGGS